jgi:hypothetical protein
MNDLFGNPIAEPKILTFEEEYQEYIKSAQWKKKRAQKIAEVGEQCQRCQLTNWSVKIGVHHKTYEHFKNEPMEDLEVLCPECHDLADKERAEEAEQKRLVEKKHKSIIRGFENWMDHGNNEDWRNMNDNHLEWQWQRFLNYIENRTKRHYEIPYWRNPDWNN